MDTKYKVFATDQFENKQELIYKNECYPYLIARNVLEAIRIFMESTTDFPGKIEIYQYLDDEPMFFYAEEIPSELAVYAQNLGSYYAVSRSSMVAR